MKKLSILLCFLFAVTGSLCVSYFNKTANKTIKVNAAVATTANDDLIARAGSLPESYCLRDDYILYTQDQDRNGLCWDFSSTMAAATTIMKATNEYYDFSELWSAVSTYVDTNYYNIIGDGGNMTYYYAAMQASGLMLESDLAYVDSYIVSNENAQDYHDFHSQYVNDDVVDSLVYDLSTRYDLTDIEGVKNHIVNHGSLYMGLRYTSGAFSHLSTIDEVWYKRPNDSVHNLPTTSGHAVSIIGWDDNFEQEIYYPKTGTTETLKGAWVILNSWGEGSTRDGILYVFYNDADIHTMCGFKYEKDTSKDLYLYYTIDSDYTYETAVKGKYYGDYVAETSETKQKNIFYDYVDLEYSYEISAGAFIKSVDIYLDNINVTNNFNVYIDANANKFYISSDSAEYGQYKVLITYGNASKTDTYLSNFFVTHGMVNENVKYAYYYNDLGFDAGYEFEYYSYVQNNKNYVVYTNQTNGTIYFAYSDLLIYSDIKISPDRLAYSITDGDSCVVTYSITSDSGYVLNYNFNVEYYEDTTLQNVYVFYDLNGGVNNSRNYHKELANSTTDLMLYEPTREGYLFTGWYLGDGNGAEKVEEVDDVHYIDWSDIHHMGENPTMYALDHYQTFYNNSNTVFVYAGWEPIQYYNIDLSVIGEGTVSYPNENNLISAEDVYTYVFTPNTGYKIKDVKVNGVSVGAVPSYTFTNVTRNQTISVEFEKISYNIAIQTEKDGETNQTTIVVEYGNSKTLTFTADEGYLIKKIIINGRNVGNVNEYTIENIRENQYVYVEMVKIEEQRTYTIEALSGDNGTISSPGTITVNEGESYTYSFTANVGYEVKDVKVNEISVGKVSSYTFANVTSNQKIYVEFAKISLNIYVQMEKDRTTTYETANVEYGANKTLNFAVDNNHYIEKVVINGVNVGNVSEYTIENIRENQYVFVGIVKIPEPQIFTIVATSGANGTISNIGSKNVVEGEGLTYSFTPNTGYQIKDVKVNEVSIGVVSSYTFVNVTSNQTISVEFEIIKLNLTVICGENGTVTSNGSSQVDYNSNQIYYIEANENYSIDYIKINGEFVENTTTLILNNITENKLIEIEFKPVKFFIEVVGGEHGIVTPSSMVDLGGRKTFDFYPHAGYAIKDVKIDGVSVGACNTYTFFNVSSEHTITVEFEVEKFDIIISVDGKGKVDCNSQLENISLGEDRTLIITPNFGWKLDKVYVNDAPVEVSNNQLVIRSISKTTNVKVIFQEKSNDVAQKQSTETNNTTLILTIVASVIVCAVLWALMFVQSHKHAKIVATLKNGNPEIQDEEQGNVQSNELSQNQQIVEDNSQEQVIAESNDASSAEINNLPDENSTTEQADNSNLLESSNDAVSQEVVATNVQPNTTQEQQPNKVESPSVESAKNQQQIDFAQQAVAFAKGRTQHFESFCKRYNLDFNANYTNAAIRYYQAYLRSLK